MSPSRLLMLGIAGPELTTAEETLFRRLQPAGFILFSRNLVSARQTRALTDRLVELCEHPILIAVDNEGGRVWRCASFTPSPPSAEALAQRGTARHLSQFGWITGQLLGQLGINFNLAPVLDIDHHPDAANALRGRCWGTRDQQVIDNAGIFNRWQRRQRILGCGKHFPAGGRARTDPHHLLPVVEGTLEELHRSDILPYTALMPELDAIMISHLHFPQVDSDGLPASLSRNIVQRFLRTQLGFDRHLVLTDDLDMRAIQERYGTPTASRLAVEAGVDLVLLCHEFMNADETVAELETLPLGALFDAEDRLERALKRANRPVFLPDRVAALCEDIAKLNADVLGADWQDERDSRNQSPVEDY